MTEYIKKEKMHNDWLNKHKYCEKKTPGDVCSNNADDDGD